MSTVHVLANPAARHGRGAARYAEVLAVLRAEGAPHRELDVANKRAAHDALAQLAATDPQARVLLVGGDGLVHLALGALAGTSVAVGIVAAGTGNDFARALGLRRGTLAEQVRRSLGPTRPLDAIRAGATWVASVATVGFAVTVSARADALRWPRGQARYTVATLAELPRLAPLSLVLELDGSFRLPVRATLLAVANTAYFGGGMMICPAALPDDGLLDIAIIGDVSAPKLVRTFPRVFRGGHLAHPQCTLLRSSRVRLIDTTTAVWGDGEPVGACPVELTAVPGVWNVAGATTRVGPESL